MAITARTELAATAIALMFGAAAAAPHVDGPAPFELPEPTGRHAVGTTAWRVTDSSRRETFTTSGEFRQVEVIAWYPAGTDRTTAALSRRSADAQPDLSGRSAGSQPDLSGRSASAKADGAKPARAPYLREGLAEVRTFATLLRAPATVFDALENVRTHAELDAPVASGRLPVLVFSHGYTGIPSAHTALLEDLASHGYAVLSVIHPYEATAATLADGRVVSMLDSAGALLPPIREVFDEWGPEDRTMTAVTSAADGTEQLRLLRGYLTTLRRTDIALRRWVDDTKLVLDRLGVLPRSSPAGELAARLDLGRVGVFGHSMGGVTAAQFCVEDRRCRAGLNLDGIPQYGTMIDAAMPRPFLMVYSARPGRAGASDPIYRRAARPYLRVDVKDTRHLDFSDMAFWGGPLRERPVLGSIPPARITGITRATVRGYFDQELLGQRSALATALPPSTFPEVTIKTVSR